jgi:hypothetical protein
MHLNLHQIVVGPTEQSDPLVTLLRNQARSGQMVHRSIDLHPQSCNSASTCLHLRAVN